MAHELVKIGIWNVLHTLLQNMKMCAPRFYWSIKSILGAMTFKSEVIYIKMDNRRQLARGIYVLWTHYLVLIYYIIQLFGHCLAMPPTGSHLP